MATQSDYYFINIKSPDDHIAILESRARIDGSAEPSFGIRSSQNVDSPYKSLPKANHPGMWVLPIPLRFGYTVPHGKVYEPQKPQTNTNAVTHIAQSLAV